MRPRLAARAARNLTLAAASAVAAAEPPPPAGPMNPPAMVPEAAALPDSTVPVEVPPWASSSGRAVRVSPPAAIPLVTAGPGLPQGALPPLGQLPVTVEGPVPPGSAEGAVGPGDPAGWGVLPEGAEDFRWDVPPGATPVIPVPGPVRVPPEDRKAPPPYCVVRALPPHDPSGVWRLRAPGTTVRLVARPGEPDTSFTGPDAGGGYGAVAGAGGGAVAVPDADLAASFAREPGAPNPAALVRAFVFECPARFPVRRFLSATESYESEGLRVHEQMVLRLASDGSYEIAFLATAPATMVRLALQFELVWPAPSPLPAPVNTNGYVTVPTGVCRGTITLPPVVLDPRRFGRSDGEDSTWEVVHRGRLSLVRRWFDEATPPLDVLRRGVARFGSGVMPAQSTAR